jgi:hypothetical protein
LGNLTLTGYNSEYKDHPFLTKRDIEGGFAQSPLRLNQGLGQLTVWNEGTIKDRAERLASQAMTIWPLPKPSASTLAALGMPSSLPDTADDDDEDEADID